jgi:opacity protein-like surface antigen
MKRLALATCFALGTCVSLPAQQSSLLMFDPAAQPSSSTPAPTFNFTLVPELTPPAAPSESFASPLPKAALPDAPAPPQSSSRNEEGYRWDLAVGYEYIHFDSSLFSANLSGLHTDLTYNLNSWFGLEGNVVSAWGGEIGGERTKYVLFAGGGRIGFGPLGKRLSPWAHALVGGVHVNPQAAHSSKNSFALQAGVGADWTYNARVSLRAEADYVRSTLYSSTQNNVQVGLGAVIHF